MSRSYIVGKDLIRTYGEGEGATVALRGVDLEVARGELVALVGPSGSGKSTLLHLLGGMDFADSGSLQVGGHELKRLDDAEAARYRRERVGFVFQFFNLVPTLTALDNVALPARLKGLSVTDARARAARLLEEVGLDQRSRDFPDTFSGGQQQRVAIARALVNKPELLLADEPTGALDRGTGAEIMSLLVELVREHGTTLIVATHDEAVVDVAAQVIHIEDGRVTRDEQLGASRS